MGALTQGSAKPPPWAESCNRFAVNPTGSWAESFHAFGVGVHGAHGVHGVHGVHGDDGADGVIPGNTYPRFRALFRNESRNDFSI
jgi:hypothetical protein